MRTLLLAAILYLIGIIIVLLFRPSLMFDDKGNWKEFGTLSQGHTLFPFWLFCIVWAIISYVISLLFVGEFKTGTIVYEASPTETPEDLVPVLPTKTKGKNMKNLTNSTKSDVHANMKPGYYVLDAKEMKRTGVPKYLYVGEGEEPVGFGKGNSVELEE